MAHPLPIFSWAKRNVPLWRRFFIFLGSHTQLESLMAFMNTISPTIKYTFTYSKQTVSFLDVQVCLSESRKRKTKLQKTHLL